MSEILQEFKRRRVDLGLSQTEMAKRLNISQSQYQKIESGGNPSLKTLTSMAMALNMKLLLVPLEKLTEIDHVIKPLTRVKRLKSLLEQFEVKENE
ncbi:MAG: helix-turn-helix transcriptional regulator [Bacteriovorax sp.]|nr:helix-turn-helix transcriptional regulator [Bacteriovorax sp.]